MKNRRAARTFIFMLCLAMALPLAARDFYWDSPAQLTESDGRFPSTATNGTVSVVLWQETVPSSAQGGVIWLSARVFDGKTWLTRERFAGPIPYAGDVPSIASATVDPSGRILVSAVTSVRNVTVYSSSDLGQTFGTTEIEDETSALLAPRIFVRADGGYLLFATRGTEENFFLVYSRSSDGRRWSSFEVFSPSSGKKRPFLPAHAAVGRSDVIVFQAFHAGANRSSYQLFSSVSTDSGSSWSSPSMISTFQEPGQPGVGFEQFHNQRPRLRRVAGTVSLVWERARTGIEKYRIYHATVDGRGALSSEPEAVSSADGYCYDPDVVEVDGKPTVLWFDNRSGANRVYMARKEGLFWAETDLSRSVRDAVFARPVIANGVLEIFWQQSTARGEQRLVQLSPDKAVDRPILRALSFEAGKRSRAERVSVSVTMPADSSDIAGYSYAWAPRSRPEVPKDIQYLPEARRVDLEAPDDGPWFLGVRVRDYAGNWSEIEYLEYVRDTTPPAPPAIREPALDARGYLASNSFSAEWDPPSGDDVAGYAWSLDYLAGPEAMRLLASLSGAAGTDPSLFAFQDAASRRFDTKRPPARVMTAGTTASFSNLDDGIYALSVAAIDSVGNVGEPAVRFLALDKYVPYTHVAFVDATTDEAGNTVLSVVGRGFADQGGVDRVYVDRDGSTPWDLELSREDGDFVVQNDRLITGIRLRDAPEGSYRVVLRHRARGAYNAPAPLAVSAQGTVKFGDFREEFIPSWRAVGPRGPSAFRAEYVIPLIVVVFALVLLAVSVRGLAGAARDGALIQAEVKALLIGVAMPLERKKREVALRKRGLGLRFKLAFFTTTLVVAVTLLVSIPLGLRFSANQERTLARGLESRVHVLLESLNSGARFYLPSQNLLELGFLPTQIAALAEARYATITGGAAGGSSTSLNFVWATNDPAIAEKIDTAELSFGGSRLLDAANDEIMARVAELDREAVERVGDLSEGIAELTQEGRKLALKTDPESVRRREEIQTISRQLEEKLNAALSELATKGIGSSPRYDPERLSRDQTEYVFFKPVLFRQGSENAYVRGTVRVGISTVDLLRSVRADRAAIVRTTAYIALFAVLIGVLGALALASIIISPIRKLASHVAMIRDTEDKEELDGKDIVLRSRDEIGLLGETINDMTRGLVRAAAASKDLIVGKEVQKMFIPLETDSAGRKLTCGSSSEENAEFFGYYEGAKGVSGDYFDYVKLDNRHYAVIKCDVAGKGVPAALIMVEVATLFLDYFKDWKYEKNGFKIDYIVSRINDLIESRGFKGRFAAFTLCIFDSVSGDVHFCNAGDNLIHVYEAATRKMRVVALPEISAAGVFPSFMVEMKGGFQVVTRRLNPGDVLFLYTDGIEEAKRTFRDASLRPIECAEPGLERESPHETHTVGQDNEELGLERVNAIIEAVFARSSYKLVKWHNPIEGEDFHFDFSTCQGTIEEAILALVSVEKVFRMYRDPAAGEFDRVQVDRKVDLFLNRHFRQYPLYCANRKDHPEYPEYLYYTHVREDAQYDDLTILGIKKK
ncbi:MAG TPA: SpoIIE family protein phosphatase [Treponemataceae bacterium]|nr:SpoIIE family protein phosphatase [Treponemataceae bacterium]